jgi:hypothetical protein
LAAIDEGEIRDLHLDVHRKQPRDELVEVAPVLLAPLHQTLHPARMRKEAEKRGRDPNQWFNNVELVTAEKIGMETTTYVRNVYKYYVAYKLALDVQEAQRKARATVK